MSDSEFSFLKGKSLEDEDPAARRELEALPQLRVEVLGKPLPKQLDWRQYGAVTKVKSQSFCSSCWSFSAIGAVEGAYKIKFRKLVEFSAQQLIDCSWGYENNGCRGGWSWRAFKWIRDHGVASSTTYGQYLGQEGYCHCGEGEHCSMAANVSFSTVKKGNKELLKRAIAQFGPVSISVHCSPKSFKFYSKGIYDDINCTQNTNHAVLVVGWGVANDREYWIIKNSWGPFWGEEGYMRLSTKNDLCGVLKNEPIIVTFGKWDERVSYPYSSMPRVSYDKDIEGRRKPLPPIIGNLRTLVEDLGSGDNKLPTGDVSSKHKDDGSGASDVDDIEFIDGKLPGFS